jgi:DNA-binding response OmpR family regulator
MSLFRPRAVVIEPQADLADAVGEALAMQGFDVTVSATHVGAARTAEGRCPQLLVACVPAHAQDFAGAYLRSCRESLGTLPTVLMLSDPHADINAEPPDAIRLIKPFTLSDLRLAVDKALSTGQGVPAPGPSQVGPA